MTPASGPTPSDRAGHPGWCDAARVAELTGLNVLDVFPAGDLAQGGRGGPLKPFPVAAAAAARLQPRAAGPRPHHPPDLPPGHTSDRAAAAVRAFEAGPGTARPDLLAYRLSNGEHAFDPGGRMAAQGRRLGPLMDRWLPDPRPHTPRRAGIPPLCPSVPQRGPATGGRVGLVGPRPLMYGHPFHRRDRRPGPAEDVAGKRPAGRVLVTGGGEHNGMLFREIGLAAEVPLLRSTRAR